MAGSAALTSVSFVVWPSRAFAEGAVALERAALPKGKLLISCTSLDLIQLTMSDYVIHSTAGVIGAKR
jgi:hypothetical protein